MQIDIKNANFKFYKWTCPFKLSDLEKELEKIKADLKEGGQDGFVLPDLSEDGQVVISKYHAAVGKELNVLNDDGVVRLEKFYQLSECVIVISREFIAYSGDIYAWKGALLELMKLTKTEPTEINVKVEKLQKIMDSMAFIRNIALDKIESPNVKRASFVGKIESTADLGSLAQYDSIVKNVKGVVNTPFGVRTIKITSDGKVQIAKKKEEDVAHDTIVWMFNLIR